jgi:DNA processing protein
VLTALEPARSGDFFASLDEDGGDGEPLWGEQSLFGLDPGATPRSCPGDELDAACGGADQPADDGRGARDRIMALLGPSPVSLDELARAAEASTREVRVTLIELELAGRVEFSGGNRVALRPARRDTG